MGIFDNYSSEYEYKSYLRAVKEVNEKKAIYLEKQRLETIALNKKNRRIRYKENRRRRVELGECLPLTRRKKKTTGVYYG